MLNCFKDFKAIIEKQSGYKIRTLRSGHDGKYTLNNLYHTTPAYTPQLNGVAERKNRTILDMTRSQLKAKKLPKQY
jgi:hypothetical protein